MNFIDNSNENIALEWSNHMRPEVKEHSQPGTNATSDNCSFRTDRYSSHVHLM